MSERYEIKEKIGQGGIGAVFKAVDTQLGREVALKRLKPASEVADDEGESYDPESLIEEAKILSSLQHPNIVTVYDTGKDEKGTFVVMEFLKGETFDATVKRGVLTAKDFREVVMQTMEGLIAAHQLKLVHRDLKPANLMLNWLPSGKFQIKILDFGLAKFSQRPTTQTSDQSDGIMGSIHFMAPEQFERLPLDARTDLYSIGCIYYYALTGKYPFRGETGAQVMASHLQNKVYPLQQIRPDLPPHITSWVMWLISRELTDRPGSAKEALDAFMAQKVINETAATPTAMPQGALQTVQAVGPAAPPPGLVPVAAVAAAPAGVGGASTGAAAVPGPVPASKKVFKKPPNFFATKAGIISLISMVFVSGIVITWVVLATADKRRARDEFVAYVDQIEAAGEEGKIKGTAESVKSVVWIMRDKEFDSDRMNGEQILFKLEGKGIDDAILEELGNAKSSAMREYLCRVAGYRKIEAAVPLILEYYQGGTEMQNKEAIVYASRLGKEKDIATLIKMFELDLSAREHDDIGLAIVDIAQREKVEEATNLSLLTALRVVKPEVKRTIYTTIGYMGGKRALVNLVQAIDPAKERESIGPITGLGHWPDPEPLSDILKFVKAVEKPTVKQVALRAYTKLAATHYKKMSTEENIKVWEEAMAAAVGTTQKSDVLKAISSIAMPWAREFAAGYVNDPDKGVARTATSARNAIERRIEESK